MYLCVCVFRYIVYGSGMFPAGARRLRPVAAARRGAEGQIQTLPLQRLRRGVCVCGSVYSDAASRSAFIANDTPEACGKGDKGEKN